jgi:UDP-glucose 4-epimerase
VKTLVVGGAGFIGSHFVDCLLKIAENEVRIYDNFTSGREWHFKHHLNDPRFGVTRGHVEDTSSLVLAMSGCARVIHLASNPDIAKAILNPTIDFFQGTALTSSVVEAARLADVKEILYASGSGVYGDLGNCEAHEDQGALVPSSPYGASKLAGEALLSAYSAMFGIKCSAFRFANVVGPRQTHGVGFDFIRRLRQQPNCLEILGDGHQSKSYIHVDDVVSAVLHMSSSRLEDFEVFNVATQDYITVNEIAELALEILGLTRQTTEFTYTGGDRGWKGDIPIVRMSTERIHRRGWSPDRGCRDALKSAMLEILSDDSKGLL